MKRINIPLAIITVIIICILWGTNHKTEESSTPMDSKNNEEEQIYESSKVPPFVEALLDSKVGCINSPEEIGEGEFILKIRTDETDWDAVNPQFIVYVDGIRFFKFSCFYKTF